MNTALPTVDTLYAVGHWLLGESRPADAVDVFRTILMMAPLDERGWLGLAGAHERLGHHQAALELYQLGEATVPSSFRCALARARLLRSFESEAASESAYDVAEERARLFDDPTADAIALERSAA